MYRQGDVLLVRTWGPIPTGAVRIEPEDGQLVLARGEATGHLHAVDASGAAFFRIGDGRLLRVDEPTKLTHQEHAAIALEPGVYRVVYQREYSPREVKRVAD